MVLEEKKSGKLRASIAVKFFGGTTFSGKSPTFSLLSDFDYFTHIDDVTAVGDVRRTTPIPEKRRATNKAKVHAKVLFSHSSSASANK